MQSSRLLFAQSRYGQVLDPEFALKALISIAQFHVVTSHTPPTRFMGRNGIFFPSSRKQMYKNRYLDQHCDLVKSDLRRSELY